MSSTQGEFDWKYFDRQGWIKDALLPRGQSRKGHGVSAATMKSVLTAINDHLGNNTEAWPSRETIAQAMGISADTVTRATQALEALSLLIIRTETTRGGYRKSYYRIVWTELQVRDPARRKAWLKMLSRDSEPNDMVREPNDMVREPNDMVREPNDMVSDELLTNNSQKNSKNSPPLKEADRGGGNAPGESPGSWKVVVSALAALGMGGARKAVAAADRRGLSPQDVDELMARWERLRARQPSVTVAYLYRWLTGESRPPEEEETRRAVNPPRSLTSDSTRLELIRGRVLKAGRRAGQNDAEISAALERSLEQAGYPPDAITIGGSTNIFNRNRGGEHAVEAQC